MERNRKPEQCPARLLRSEVSSAENVENVVSAPQKPVMRRSRHSGEIVGTAVNAPTTAPITQPPIRVAASVPGIFLPDVPYSCSRFRFECAASHACT
jgi:hypothetical protein